MIKEKASSKEMLFTIILFVMGSSIIAGIGAHAEQDTWISLLISTVMIMPIIVMYVRILKLFPDKNLFDIFEILFGKIIGKVITIIMVWYAIHLGSLVLRNFSEFFKVAAMPETPELPIMILILIICVYIAKSGIEVLGRWSLVTFPILIFILFITVVFSVPIIETQNIFPVMNHSIGTIMNDSLIILTFPFGETILFLTIGNALKKEDIKYKVFIYAILISSLILLIVVIRNIMILGLTMKSISYFPSYEAVRVISIGDFLTRIEGAVMVNFLLAGIVKITVCIFAASKGISKLFNIGDYKKTVIPVGLIILSLTPILYNNINEMFDFINVYRIYALPFQILIPVTIWIYAEIKIKVLKKKH